MPTKTDLCKSCGECCQWFILQIRKPEPFTVTYEWKEWLRARGIEIVRETQREWRLKIPLPCPHLDFHLEKEGSEWKRFALCNIYADRPNVCRVFDGRLEDSHDGLNCLWKTEPIEEEKEKKYGEPFRNAG